MANEPYYEIVGDQVNGYWFRLRAGNGEIVVWSEKYSALTSCQRAIDWVRYWAPSARIVNRAA